MMRSFAAELLVLRRRRSTWILLGIWTSLAIFFAYILPYATGGPTRELLPQNLHSTVIVGFPFFGGVFALMLGVLSMGSEYGWDTLKTLFTQGPGRMRIFGAKTLALAVTLVPFVGGVFVAGGAASSLIAWAEGSTGGWPDAGLLLVAFAAGWLILAVWAALGLLLGVLTRGTSLAIGIGILYALVIEGLVSAIAGGVSQLEGIARLLVRANGYSLLSGPLGLSPADVADNGPGAYFGPFVDGMQALFLLVLYLVIFGLVAALVLRRRDVV